MYGHLVLLKWNNFIIYIFTNDQETRPVKLVSVKNKSQSYLSVMMWVIKLISTYKLGMFCQKYQL